jgi:hypothetical protein
LAEPLIVVARLPGRVSRDMLAMVRASSVLAGPVSPAFARLAGAAVVMSTTALTGAGAGFRRTPPAVSTTTLDDVLAGAQLGCGTRHGRPDGADRAVVVPSADDFSPGARSISISPAGPAR